MARSEKVEKVSRVAGVEKAKGFLVFVGGGIVLAIALTNLGLWAKNEIAKWQRSPIEREITKWESVVNETPTYRDGYLKLSTLYWKLHEDEKVRSAISRAEIIDPNYEEIEKLKNKLGF